jgi:hypothetical protein
MKFNTDKYKLSLFTELECEDCIKLKEQLTAKAIPFHNRCITANTPNGHIKENSDNRWDFIDADKDNPGKIKFAPVMILESIDGDVEYFSAGAAFETVDEAIGILEEKYFKS